MNMGLKPQLYFAAPLFTDAERSWNGKLVAGLRACGYNIWLPQERAIGIIGQALSVPARALYEDAIAGVESAQGLIAVLDGADADSGTCFECGYATALAKVIIGV